jgi:hypothetical protein
LFILKRISSASICEATVTHCRLVPKFPKDFEPIVAGSSCFGMQLEWKSRRGFAVTCPATASLVLIPHHVDADGLKAIWNQTLVARCPSCGQEHEVSVKEAFLSYSLALEDNEHPEVEIRFGGASER